MALKKTVAGYFKKTPTEITGIDGEKLITVIEEWIDQQDIEMHPLEENEIRAHWKIHDILIQIPPKPTTKEEHELLITKGADSVVTARKVWEDIYNSKQPRLIAAQDFHAAQHKIWCDHVEHCLAHGLDIDTHDKEKYSAT